MSLTAALLWCLAPLAVDGDTVRCGDSQTRVRMWGVSAPETGQPGADLAKAALQKRIAGGIVCEPRGNSYNRIVGLCYDGTGRDVAMQLLKVDRTVVEACTFSRNYYGTCPVVKTSASLPLEDPDHLTHDEAVCARPEIVGIKNDDPGLRTWLGLGESLDDAKIALATKRANSCD